MLFYLVSVLFALTALILLVVFAAINGETGAIVGFSIYGAALVAFYIVRWIYVMTHSSRAIKSKLLKLDHVMIYLLTAATYTPVSLMLPDRVWGWTIFGVVWGLFLFGSILRLTEKVDKKWTTLGVYSGLIVLDLVAFSVVHDFLTKKAVFWLSLGGASYLFETFIVVYRPKLSFLKGVDAYEKLALPFMIFASFSHFWAMLKHMILL